MVKARLFVVVGFLAVMLSFGFSALEKAMSAKSAMIAASHLAAQSQE